MFVARSKCEQLNVQLCGHKNWQATFLTKDNQGAQFFGISGNKGSQNAREDIPDRWLGWWAAATLSPLSLAKSPSTWETFPFVFLDPFLGVAQMLWWTSQHHFDHSFMMPTATEYMPFTYNQLLKLYPADDLSKVSLTAAQASPIQRSRSDLDRGCSRGQSFPAASMMVAWTDTTNGEGYIIGGHPLHDKNRINTLVF